VILSLLFYITKLTFHCGK